MIEAHAKPRDSTRQRQLLPLCQLCATPLGGQGIILTTSGSELASVNGLVSYNELISNGEAVSDSELVSDSEIEN